MKMLLSLLLFRVLPMLIERLRGRCKSGGQTRLDMDIPFRYMCVSIDLRRECMMRGEARDELRSETSTDRRVSVRGCSGGGGYARRSTVVVAAGGGGDDAGVGGRQSLGWWISKV